MLIKLTFFSKSFLIQGADSMSPVSFKVGTIFSKDIEINKMNLKVPKDPFLKPGNRY